MMSGESNCNVLSDASIHASSETISSSPVLLLGVKLIWVSAAHRRRGLAHRMLDAARRNFAYGAVLKVPLGEVAFSQPTQDGFRFASAYCKSSSVWAY